MRNYGLAALVPCILLSFSAIAQNPGAKVTSAQSSGWQQVQGLGPHSRIFVKTDKQNAVCFVHFVEEQQLTCSRSESIGSSTLVFPRNEVKSIKLERGGALGGLVLGVTGGAVGYADDLFAGPVVYQR
jgi:hypothetical protein